MIFQVTSLKSQALPIVFYYQNIFIVIMLHLYFAQATVSENENLIWWFDIKITSLTKDSRVSLKLVLLSLLTAF